MTIISSAVDSVPSPGRPRFGGTLPPLVLALVVVCGSRAWAAQESPRAPSEATTRDVTAPIRFGAVVLDPEVRLDVDWTPADGADPGGLSLAGKRVGLEGRFGRRLGFAVSAELTSPTPWRNARLTYDTGPFTVDAGQFRVPFGLDGTRGATEREFILRSRLADAFSMGRDVGISVAASAWRKRVSVETAYFRHDGSRQASDDGVVGGAHDSVVARLEVSPFLRTRGALRQARLGVSVASSQVPEALSSLTLETLSGRALTTPAFWARGARRRTAIDFSWKRGPGAIAAEFVTIADERLKQGISHDNLQPLTGGGWYVSGAWVLTGEAKAKHVRPRRALLAGGVGAIELVARVEHAWLGRPGVGQQPALNPRASLVPGSGLHVMTSGVNWYVASGARLQVNVARERVLGATNQAFLGATTRYTGLLRLQVFL